MEKAKLIRSNKVMLQNLNKPLGIHPKKYRIVKPRVKLRKRISMKSRSSKSS
jgi:hypothetical protein